MGLGEIFGGQQRLQKQQEHADEAVRQFKHPGPDGNDAFIHAYNRVTHKGQKEKLDDTLADLAADTGNSEWAVWLSAHAKHARRVHLRAVALHAMAQKEQDPERRSAMEAKAAIWAQAAHVMRQREK